MARGNGEEEGGGQAGEKQGEGEKRPLCVVSITWAPGLSPCEGVWH